MGAILSSENPSNQNAQNYSSSKMASTLPNSQNPDPKSPQNQNPDPKSPQNQNQNPDPKTQDTQNPQISNQPINADETGQIHDETSKNVKVDEDDDEEEEEGDCGFCLFMKGGGCKDQFIAWEQCVEDSEKKEEDMVEKCFEVTANLKKCMEAHSDYYEPILRAEKAAEEEVKQELDREAESKSNEKKNSVEENAEIRVQNEG